MMAYSVIIPTYNRADCLPRAINSLVEQNAKPKEIIIIDDGSTDNTQELICDFQMACELKKIKIKYHKTANKGVSAARNLGIELARSNWIAFLDSDDRWKKSKAEKQLTMLSENPQFKICHTDEIWMRGGVRVNPMKKHAKKGGWIYQHCLPLCAISPSSVMIHKDIFADIGKFDEDLPACEDYDLWLRIAAKYPVLYINEMLITKYGGHDDQLSKQYWGMDRFRIISLQKMLEPKILKKEDYFATLAILLKKTKILLNGAIKRNKKDAIIRYQVILDKYANQTISA